MSRDPRERQAQLDAFADAVGQIHAPLSTRQRSAGWHRLQQSLASGRSSPGEPPGRWRWTRRLQLGFALGLAAISFALVWRHGEPSEPPAIQYVVSGDVTIDAGGVLSARNGAAQLVFTDGSRVGLRARTRLNVAATKPRGSDIRLADGTIDVDVRHHRGTSWTFRAGPYVVFVKGTSFALGWDSTEERLALRMLSGSVAVVGPAGTRSLTVVGGESVFLDGAGHSLGSLPARESTPAASTPTRAAAPTPPPPHVADATSAVRRLASRRDHAGLAHGDWTSLLAHGDFDAIIEQAKKGGLDACLRDETEQNLAALADAARYTQHVALARRALLALRARFASTTRARDAAFFLARLSETTSPGGGDALSWYDRYLGESGGGSYAEEALGREMVLLRRNDPRRRARSVAGRYLKAYPHGIYANDAVGLLGPTPAP